MSCGARVKDLRFVGAMINGTTDGRFLDHPSYDGLLAAAVELDVPIYIHPHLPPPAVQQAYYSGLPEGADRVLATAGWGWHSEVAIQVLRMVLAGTLDKHPKLKMIIGHMGEMLPVMLARIDEVVRARHRATSSGRQAATILDQVWITTSGIFSQPPFIAALQTFGIDRIMFSVDYPFAPNARGREFLDEVALVAGRHGQAHPRQCGCAAEAEGVAEVSLFWASSVRGRAGEIATAGVSKDGTRCPEVRPSFETELALLKMRAEVYSIICRSRSLCAFGTAIISVTIFCIASPVVGSMSNFSRLASSINSGS